MPDKFKGFWMMVEGERDEQYLHPATPEDVATQLRAMGWTCASPGALELKDLPGIVKASLGMHDELGDWPNFPKHEESRTKVPRMPEQKHHIKAGDDVTEHVNEPLGPFKAKATPYLREIMEELKEGDPVKMVTITKGATPGPTCARTDLYKQAEAASAAIKAMGKLGKAAKDGG